MASKKPVSKAEVTPKRVRRYVNTKNLIPGFKGYSREGTRGGHLSQQQELFCLRLAILNNASQAARDAGYSQKTPGAMARNLLLKPHIRARVDELRASLRSASVMAIDERKEKLTEFARNGNPLLTNPISAIDLLNKMDGAYAPEKHTDIVITLTGDDLARIYREARGAFLQAGGQSLGVADGGGDGERPAAGAGDDQVPAVAPPAQGASGDREKR